MTSLATTDVQDDSTPVDDTPTPAATNTEPTNKWAENNDDSEEEDDDDVAPGRENKKRARPESSVQEGQNKSTKTSSDETEDGEDDEGAVVTITITIPSNLAGCVIGRGGTVIKSTREQSGANVNVSKEEISPGLREVTLTGQAHEVAAARTMVEAQVEAKKTTKRRVRRNRRSTGQRHHRHHGGPQCQSGWIDWQGWQFHQRNPKRERLPNQHSRFPARQPRQP
jgi:hypothetical protein